MTTIGCKESVALEFSWKTKTPIRNIDAARASLSIWIDSTLYGGGIGLDEDLQIGISLKSISALRGASRGLTSFSGCSTDEIAAKLTLIIYNNNFARELRFLEQHFFLSQVLSSQSPDGYVAVWFFDGTVAMDRIISFSKESDFLIKPLNEVMLLPGLVDRQLLELNRLIKDGLHMSVLKAIEMQL